jgi:hypothetical protein
MALTKVSYSMIQGAQYNVLDYGAVGDGVTNNNTAFAAVTAAAKVTGGTIYFPEGTYLYSSSIVIDDPSVQLLGDGLDATILNFTGDSHAIVIGDDGGNAYGKFSQFKITGTNAAKSGIRVTGITNCLLDNIYITGFIGAFVGGGGTVPGSGGACGVWVNTRNLTGGFVLSLRIENCIIETNFTGVDFTGTAIGATNDIRIVRNRIRDAKGGYQIYANITSVNWTFEENVFEAQWATNPALLIAKGNIVSVSKNYFEAVTAAPCIVFNDPLDANVNVTTVTVSNNSFVTSIGYAHAIEWYGNNNIGALVTNNYFSGYTYALKLAGTYAGMVVESNNYLTTGISDFGGIYFNCRFEDGTTDVTFRTTVRGGMWLAQGGFGTTYATTSSTTYQVPVGACRIVFTGAGASVFTLVAATSGRELLITNQTANAITSASANVVPIAGGSATTAILAGNVGKWVLLVGNGSDWQIMAAN